jgi:hypothetical protein
MEWAQHMLPWRQLLIMLIYKKTYIAISQHIINQWKESAVLHHRKKIDLSAPRWADRESHVHGSPLPYTFESWRPDAGLSGKARSLLQQICGCQLFISINNSGRIVILDSREDYTDAAEWPCPSGAALIRDSMIPIHSGPQHIKMLLVGPNFCRCLVILEAGWAHPPKLVRWGHSPLLI